MIERFTNSIWFVFTESGVWLIVGFLLAGVVHAFVPAAVLLRQLGKPGISSIAKAAAFGVPLPLCSCSVIPVAAGLRRAGAGKGASAAFTISTPQTGEESIPLTWALFGPVFALARPVIAVGTAFVAGVLIDRFDGEVTQARNLAAPMPDTGCCPTSDCPAPTSSQCPQGVASSVCCVDETTDGDGCSADAPPKTETHLRARLSAMLIYSFVTLPKDLAPWLMLGLGGAAVIGAAVPPGWIAEIASSELLQMIAMLLVGIPLYICATASTPLAFGLVAAGLSPGAALVLLLAGPATNIATMVWVYKDLGARALAIYLGVIAVFALATGMIFNAFFRQFVQLAEVDPTGGHQVGPVAIAGAIGLAALLLIALWLRYISPRLPGRDRAKSPDCTA